MLVKLDLHIHSHYSYDSNSSITKIIEKAKKKGLSGISITDHGDIKGNLEAQKINNDPNFLIIPGQETRTEIGDILGLFIKKKLISKKFENLIKEIKSQGGLVVLPHPKCHKNYLSTTMSQIDLIEVFNARSKKKNNEMAKKLATKYQKPFIGASDAHSYFEIGFGQTILNSQSLNLERIKKDLLKLNNQLKCRRSPYHLSHGLSVITEKIKSLKK